MRVLIPSYAYEFDMCVCVHASKHAGALVYTHACVHKDEDKR